MTDAARIAVLEAALADVLARLDPQRLAQSMEFVWQPRGGEPRIIDENGVTLDYVPAIQFLGATTELDVPAQRAVVTSAASLSGVFAGVPETHRVRFTRVGDPTKVDGHLLTQIDNPATTANKHVALEVGAALAGSTTPFDFNGVYTGGPSAVTVTGIHLTDNYVATLVEGSLGSGVTVEADATAAQGRFAARAQRNTGGGGGNTATTSIQARGQGSSVCANDQSVSTVDSALGYLYANGSVASGGAVLYYESTNAAFASIRVDLSAAPVPARTVYDNASKSNFIQAEASTAAAAAVRRVQRGPFTGAVAALAAGASTTFTLANARSGSDYVVLGGVNGAAGSEDLHWSWANAAGAADVDVTVTNRGAGALTATMRFYVVSVA